MAIKYYPNRIQKKLVPAIDRELAKRHPYDVKGRKDINASALRATVYTDSDWQIDSIGFDFNNANARDFTAMIRNGRRVLSGLNDSLWFVIDTTGPEQIILDDGFYTGTQLATQLQTQLDANSSFVASGITFTVAYDSNTGLYTITPSSGNVQYLNVNGSQTLRTRDSRGGHLFGFNADTTLTTSILSDTTVFGLDKESAIISQSASTALTYHHSSIHILTVDQALQLGSNFGVDTVIDYTVVYEEIV